MGDRKKDWEEKSNWQDEQHICSITAVNNSHPYTIARYEYLDKNEQTRTRCCKMCSRRMKCSCTTKPCREMARGLKTSINCFYDMCRCLRYFCCTTNKSLAIAQRVGTNRTKFSTSYYPTEFGSPTLLPMLSFCLPHAPVHSQRRWRFQPCLRVSKTTYLNILPSNQSRKY